MAAEPSWMGSPAASQDIDAQLQFRVGKDLLREFVLGHTLADVLRELVQNEYDAAGSRLTLSFGQAELLIRGDGESIDTAGWRRLSVMMSTGEIAGSPDESAVEPKVNGIGSKNLGLRSLFLIGDRLEIRSGGRMTVMDASLGTLPKPLPDKWSAGRRGVEIRVPYRGQNNGLLRAFSPDREAAALDQFADQMVGTIVKLGDAAQPNRLRLVEVSSARLRRRISWTQRVTALRAGSGVVAVRRSVRQYDSRESKSPSRVSLDELEFSRLVEPPEELAAARIPSYFRASRNRIRIAVSFRMRGNAPHADELGRYYYPLIVPDGTTGCAISVCAPFLMDEDRSALLEHPGNDRLEEEAAELAADVLVRDWHARLGARAYELLPQRPGTSAFGGSLWGILSSKPVWPSAAQVRGGRSHFVPAASVVVPDFDALTGFLDDEQYLSARLTENPHVVDMAVAAGASRFTMNSLVRLRCNGSADVLATSRGEGDADYSYDDVADVYEGKDGVALQLRMGRVFDEHRRRLTVANRQDLENTPTMLAADGSLAAAAELWVVEDRGIAAHLPPETRLHPELAEVATYRRLCRTFELHDWLVDVCRRSQAGEASEEEREAVYAFIRRVHGRLPSRILAALRRAAVLKDHDGAWVSAQELVLPSEQYRPFGHVLHFPHPEYTTDRQLLARLKIRVALRSRDIVELASAVSDDLAARAFENILLRALSLVAGRTRQALATLPFLRSSDGGLAAPEDLYLHSAALEAVLGPGARWASGEHRGLYRRLGVRDAPSSGDILRHLHELQETGQAPTHARAVYTALATAVRSEGGNRSGLADEPIVWVEQHGFVAPSEVLVGHRIPSPLAALPNIKGPEDLCDAIAYLGASRSPAGRHWAKFFELVSDAYEHNGSVPAPLRVSLQSAYGRLLSTPTIELSIGLTTKFLLSAVRTLHSLGEVESGRFVVNDDPALAAAALALKVPIAVADEDEDLQLFLRRYQVKSLSQVTRRIGVQLGGTSELPPAFHARLALEQTRSRYFASAVAAIARHELRASDQQPPRVAAIIRRFSGFDSLVAAEAIEVEARVGGHRIRMGADFWVAADMIAFSNARTREDFQSGLASALVEALGVSGISRHRMSDAIYRILGRKPKAIEAYLGQRGIPWKLPSAQDSSDESDEMEVEGLLTSALAATLAARARADHPIPPRPTSEHKPPLTITEPSLELPPFEDVHATAIDATETWQAPDRKRRITTSPRVDWQPPTPADTARDAIVGQRAEAIAFRQEQERVEARGQDPGLVMWVSRDAAGADHDIRSVDEDGGTIFIEVKGTLGRDGRFQWPVDQLSLAIRHRSRYLLWRVYEVASTTPPYRIFRDPIGMLASGRLRIDVSGFGAEVEPLPTRSSAAGARQ